MSPVEQWILDLGPWAWWVLGLILIGLEILAPGTFFLWFGLSAILVGAIALFVDLPWQASLALFLVFSLTSLLVGRRLMRRVRSEEGDPNLNKRGSRYIGRTFVLKEPLAEGTGNLSIDDTVWRITGPDLPAGVSVQVVDIDGVRLVVQAETK